MHIKFAAAFLLATTSGAFACSGDCAATPTELLDDEVLDPMLEGQTNLLQLSMHVGAVEDTQELEAYSDIPPFKFSGSLSYLTVKRALIPERKAAMCNFTEVVHYGQRLSDDCCSLTWWQGTAEAVVDSPKEQTRDGKHYDCFVSEEEDHLFYRSYAGCVGSEVQDIRVGNYCVPDGISVGAGYPISSASVAGASWRNGSYDSCRCGDAGRLTAEPIKGSGCFVAFSPYMSGLKAGAGGDEAIFAKVEGNCETRER